MKIRLDVDDKHFEYSTEPMTPERFKIVCNLVGGAIGGAVLLGAVHMIGVWAAVWAVVALVAVGLYKLIPWLNLRSVKYWVSR